MDPEILEKFVDKISLDSLRYGVNVLAAVFIFVIGRWAAKFFSHWTGNVLDRAKVEKTLVSFIRHLAFYGILILVIIAALNKLGIETSSFIAVVGAVSFAVGLALQGALANFAAGILLILFHPFKVGDIVEAGGAQGVVHEIQIFNTVIIGPDKKRFVVPNAKITSDKITVFPA